MTRAEREAARAAARTAAQARFEKLVADLARLGSMEAVANERRVSRQTVWLALRRGKARFGAGEAAQ